MFWRNLKLCAAVPSNWRKPRSKFNVTDAKFKLEFPEDMATLKDKKRRRYEVIMGNREVNYPGILSQDQQPTHLSLLCNSRVKIDVNVYNNTTRNDIKPRKVIQASSAYLTNIFEMVNHPVINILMIPESKIKKRHYWLIFKLPRRHVGKIQCNDLVFCFIMTHERMHEKYFA